MSGERYTTVRLVPDAKYRRMRWNYRLSDFSAEEYADLRWRARGHLTQKRVRRRFRYDQITGKLFFRGEPIRFEEDSSPEVLCREGQHHYQVKSGRYHWPAAIIVWVYHHGKLPAGPLQHINSNMLDYRIENLRLLSRGENSYKAKTEKPTIVGDELSDNAEHPIEDTRTGLVTLKENGELVTTSLLVAERFRKKHPHVLRDIRNLDCSEEFRASNFRLSSYPSIQGKEFPMYEITKDGFALLAFGFTGKEAAVIKEDSLAEFNLPNLGEPPSIWRRLNS